MPTSRSATATPKGSTATAREVEKPPGSAACTGELDVRDVEAVDAWAAEVDRELGQVDILVNNAGGTFYAHFLDTNAKGERTLVDENFTSVTNFVRACVPLMPVGGSIVNVTSIEAHRAAPGFGIYAAMKAAVESLTKTLALELAPRRIRVNRSPPTPSRRPATRSIAEAVGTRPRRLRREGPARSGGRSTTAPAAIVFLATDLSAFMSGTTLHVDGGSHAASGWVRREDGTYEP